MGLALVRRRPQATDQSLPDDSFMGTPIHLSPHVGASPSFSSAVGPSLTALAVVISMEGRVEGERGDHPSAPVSEPPSTSESPRRLIAKVILLGDGAVGKTSLISRYVFSMFDPHYVETLGTNVTARQERVETPEGTLDVRLQIWDVIGQERFDSIYMAYYQEADGALLVCDGTRRETLDGISGWLHSAEVILGKFPAVFAINKSDLPPAFLAKDVEDRLREISHGQFAGSPVYSVSARTGENVRTVFQELTRAILERRGIRLL